jgi:hypothetical protein
LLYSALNTLFIYDNIAYLINSWVVFSISYEYIIIGCRQYSEFLHSCQNVVLYRSFRRQHVIYYPQWLSSLHRLSTAGCEQLIFYSRSALCSL